MGDRKVNATHTFQNRSDKENCQKKPHRIDILWWGFLLELSVVTTNGGLLRQVSAEFFDALYVQGLFKELIHCLAIAHFFEG